VQASLDNGSIFRMPYFYDEKQKYALNGQWAFALIQGRGKGENLPPRDPNVPLYGNNALLSKMPNLELIILIGAYAADYLLWRGHEKKF